VEYPNLFESNGMTSSGRYDTAGYPEDQYEPGSDGTVLKNLLGITSREGMAIVETEQLWRAQEHLLEVIEEDQQLTAHDIFDMHRIWLGTVYEWAGQERRVNVSKDGFPFAMARTITGLMLDFERNQLARYTPCRFDGYDEIAQALAEVHVELMLIHPFREGNGRLGTVTRQGIQALALAARQDEGQRTPHKFANAQGSGSTVAATGDASTRSGAVVNRGRWPASPEPA